MYIKVLWIFSLLPPEWVLHLGWWSLLLRNWSAELNLSACFLFHLSLLWSFSPAPHLQLNFWVLSIKNPRQKTCLGFTHRLLCCNVCSLSLYAHPSPRRYHTNKMAVLLTYESSHHLLPFPISQWLVRLLVYSGRTVCDFHTILFSLLGKPFY